MAGLEVVVRPVILPNIRPPIPRVLAPPDDPTQGIAVISGGGGNFVSGSYSWSASVSKQSPHTESKRQVNVERVYQEDDDGTINKENFIDVERLKKVRLETELGPIKALYADPPARPNVETLQSDKTIKSSG